MHKIDRKITILRILQEQKGPIALASLIHLLEETVPERSIRRYLTELIEENLIRKTGEKKGSRYQAVLEKSFKNEKGVEKSLWFSNENLQILQPVKQPLYLREPTSYHAEFLEAYKPNETFYLTHSQRELLQSLGERHHHQDVAGTYARHIYNRLLIDLSYNSSRLEGNTYSLLETEKLIMEGNISANKLNEEAVMILNHKEAIRYLVENIGKIRIEPQSIFTMHYLLADALLPANECGLVRTHGVKIGGSTYIPLDHKDSLENYLSVICEKASQIQNPYEQSFFLLVHIAYLQGFQDCNKSTSRLSANIPLIRENLVPLSFNDVLKEDYTDAMLAVYELNDVRPLADLYLFSYARTCKQYTVNIESTGFDRIKIQYRQQRREILSAIIRQKLTKNAMMQYIEAQSAARIPEIDLEAFRTTILEDIRVLSIAHVRGMGIDAAEFYAWEKLQK